MSERKLPEPPAPEEVVEGAATVTAEKDAPKKPKDTAPAKAKPPRGPGRPPKPKLGERIEGMIGGIGLAVFAFNPADGQAVIAGAHELATALEKWADENPAVRRTLERALEATTAGAVIIALAKIAVPIAGNHGIIPADMAALAGGPTPAPVPQPAAAGNGAASP